MAADDAKFREALSRAKEATQLGWKLNDKLEVRWEILRDDQETPQTKWWGARLVEVDTVEPRIATLLYDAVEEFEETRSRVLFLSEVRLYDVDEGGEVPYRREGDLMDTTDCEKEQADVVTFEELAQEDAEADAASEAEMRKLPHTVQVQMAERFEQFKSGFIDFLRQKTAERGSGALIDADDIADFVSEMKNKDSIK